MLFNIGALYTQIGARQDRSAAAGIDRAIDAFQRAAGTRNKLIIGPTRRPSRFLHSPVSSVREFRCVQLPQGELLQCSQSGHEQSVPVYAGAADDRPGAGVRVRAGDPDHAGRSLHLPAATGQRVCTGK